MTRLAVVGPEEGLGHVLVGHPEGPGRVRAAMAGVADLHLGADLRLVEGREATIDELARVHTPAYLQQLEAVCRSGGGQLDPDTFALGGSWTAARRAAGAGLVAVAALRSGEADVAFVAARPPGHHALAGRSMGFCLLNNIAVAAASLAVTGERVLIIDWDVHHGNGTEEMFWDDRQVLYVSTHQTPFYPGTGRVTDVGGADARGLTINIPLPAGATGDVVRQALEEVAAPVVERFEPTWVLVSAGFDAHRDDPLADLRLSAGDFGCLSSLVARFASRPGRLAFFLEGGYDTAALRSSVAASLAVLVGGGASAEPPTQGGPGREAVAIARAVHARIAKEELWA
jgi:acetoin utilization deacetylase AcuC-like enzyme